MKTLLTALQEGRLIELPDGTKEEALEFLVHLLAAIPDLDVDSDELLQSVLQREKAGNTALGQGIACPHARSLKESDMLCVLGWSPNGIDYGASDQKRVHLVVLYYIPDSQKGMYLREVSSLIQAIKSDPEMQIFSQSESLAAARDKLLDWVSTAVEAGMPQTKARMIRLESRTAAAQGESVAAISKPTMVSFSIVRLETGQQVVLSTSDEFVQRLEQDQTLSLRMRQEEEFDLQGYRIFRRSGMVYGPRWFGEGLAVKLS